MNTQKFNFSVNNWDHLYSLQKAISYHNQLTGRELTISGRLLKHSFLNNIDTAISITFFQSDQPPNYNRLDSNIHLIGEMLFLDQKLTSNIHVDRTVFEELRKNLMEYADIEGIHIMLNLEVISEGEQWTDNTKLKIIQLDYAMKGDNL